MADDYEMGDMNEDIDDKFQEKESGGSESVVEDYSRSNTRVTDTSSAQAREGEDIQGIPWDKLSITREKWISWRTICKYLDQGVSFCCRATYNDNTITNVVEIYDASSGGVHFMPANNDCGVRDYDLEKFQLSNLFDFPWPVNHTSLSPDRKLLVIVRDSPEGMLVDAHSGKIVKYFHGHLDFSFASAWNPDSRTFATGNQDKTCRIWDVRNLSKSLAVLRGSRGAIRSIRFTSDGQFMAMAEPADFVHIFDVGNGYEKEQELDFFGEVSGIAFSPDTDALFVGVWDRTYGSSAVWPPAERFRP